MDEGTEELARLFAREIARPGDRRPLLSAARGGYHSRADWGARGPRGSPSHIDPVGPCCHYVDEVVAVIPHDQCAALMRSIQDLHMDDRGWNDYAYNFAVCRHGDVWEGRGINVRSAAQGTDAGNSGWVAICALIGNEPWTEDVRAGVHQAAQILGVADGRWTVHQDHYSSSCCGAPGIEWVRSGHPLSGAAPDDDFTAADLAQLHEFAGRVGV